MGNPENQQEVQLSLILKYQVFSRRLGMGYLIGKKKCSVHKATEGS